MESAYKRQKRAIAGEAFKALAKKTKSGAKKRPSVAQPRPECKVPPGFFKVESTNPNDVLNGRGAGVYNSPGNVQMRELVEQRRPEYLAEEQKKLRKPFIAAQIVSTIRSMNPPGRFLEKNKSDNLWWEVGDKRAIKKVQQQLREGAPKLREQHSTSYVDSPPGSITQPDIIPSSPPRHGFVVNASSNTMSDPSVLSGIMFRGEQASQISALTDGSRAMMPPAARKPQRAPAVEDSMSWLSNVSLVGSHNSNCSELNFENMSLNSRTCKLSLSEASAASALMSITMRDMESLDLASMPSTK